MGNFWSRPVGKQNSLNGLRAVRNTGRLYGFRYLCQLHCEQPDVFVLNVTLRTFKTKYMKHLNIYNLHFSKTIIRMIEWRRMLCLERVDIILCQQITELTFRVFKSVHHHAFN
jgi:hypothetical protein